MFFDLLLRVESLAAPDSTALDGSAVTAVAAEGEVSSSAVLLELTLLALVFRTKVRSFSSTSPVSVTIRSTLVVDIKSY